MRKQKQRNGSGTSYWREKISKINLVKQKKYKKTKSKEVELETRGARGNAWSKVRRLGGRVNGTPTS